MTTVLEAHIRARSPQQIISNFYLFRFIFSSLSGKKQQMRAEKTKEWKGRKTLQKGRYEHTRPLGKFHTAAVPVSGAEFVNFSPVRR